MVSELVKNIFPYSQIRAGQEELITDLEQAFQEGKILLAHAPTGLGKTASALSTVLPAVLEKIKSGEKRVIFYLTNRQTQHNIAVNTLKEIQKKNNFQFICVDLIGKIGMCNQEVAGLFGSEFNEYCKTIVQKGECEFYNRVCPKKVLTVEAKKILGEIKKSPALHNEELRELCRQENFCSYEMALALAKDALIIIGDYYYLFNPFVQNTLFNKLSLDFENCLVIVDEAHNLPLRIAEMLSNNLSTNTLRNALQESKKFHFDGLIFWLQELNRIITELGDFTPKFQFSNQLPKEFYNEKEKERIVSKESFLNEIKKVTDYDELINELEMAAEEVRKKQRKSYLGGIASFLSAWKGADDGYCRIISEQSGKFGPVIVLSYLCLDPSLITAEIFQRIPSGILMSGTLKPTFMYKDLLGITKEKGIEKEYVSPFPRENKLSLIIPETSTKYSLRGEAMYKKIAAKCLELALLIPGNVAFFFPSYNLRDKICIYFPSSSQNISSQNISSQNISSQNTNFPKKLFWEKAEMNKEEKELFLAQFKEEKSQGGVLLGVTGANFAEGIDFPGDLLNGVIVVGLPLSKPDLHLREKIAYYEKKFGKGWDYGYTYPAMNKCQQSSGRCIRSETDRGVIIYLEERFAWPSYLCCFPKEGLIITKDYALLIKKFFEDF